MYTGIDQYVKVRVGENLKCIIQGVAIFPEELCYVLTITEDTT